MRALLPLLAILAFAGSIAIGTRNPAAILQPPSPGRWEAQEYHQANASGEHQATQADQQSPKYQPPPVIHLDDAPNEHRVRTDSEREGRWYTNPDWWVAGFTAALVVVTAGLWIFTALLWRTTRRAVIDGEKAIVAAIRHADTADNTAGIMKETAERQLRAYVFVDTVDVHNTNLGETPIVYISIKNYGRTPAYRMASWARVGFQLYPLDGELPPAIAFSPERALAPGATFIIAPAHTNPLHQQYLDAMGKGTHALYLVGEIRYWDAFDEFCFFTGGEIEFGRTTAAYREGNDAT